jgi:autotransporter-associated beta strand protein
MRSSRFNRFIAFASLTLLPGALFAADRVRNDTANNLISDSAWITTPAPGASDRAVWNSASVGGATTLGGNASWQGILISGGTPSSGPLFTNAVNPSAFTLTLGSGGIDLNNGGNTNRGITFESNTRLNLAANQTWKLGLGSSTAANLVVSSVISGTGALAITRDAASSNLLQLNGANTFTGGFTLNSGAVVTLGVAAVISGGNTTSSALGSYDGTQFLTLNGGRINSGNFSFHARDAKINGDFTFVTTARTDFQGGYDLQNGTRTMTLTRGATAANTVIQGGNVALRLSNISGTSFSNGTLRLAADAGITGANFVPVIAVAGTTFTANAGLTLGPKVIYSAGTGTLNGATTVPSVTLEAGSYWNLAEGAAIRNPQVNSLAGAGTVLPVGTATAGTAYTLTIKGNSGTVSDFSGSVVNSDTTTFATSTVGIVGVTKEGSTTQIFSGSNSYTGPTIINGGSLVVNGNISTSSLTTVNTGGTLAGSGTVGSTSVLGGTFAPGNSIDDLNIVGDLTLGPISSSNFEISAAGNSSDLAIVSALLNFGGTLNVSNIAGVLALGNTFNLFDFASKSGTFSTVNLPTLSSGLGWDQDNLYTTGVISVIPEPGAALLGGLGLLVLLRRRR